MLEIREEEEFAPIMTQHIFGLNINRPTFQIRIVAKSNKNIFKLFRGLSAFQTYATLKNGAFVINQITTVIYNYAMYHRRLTHSCIKLKISRL